MQRLVQLYAASQQQQPISTSAVANIPSTQYRSTHTSRGGWPYSPSPDLASSQPPASSSSTSSPSTSSSPHVASRTTATTRSISRTVAELLENIRQMKGAKDLWEVSSWFVVQTPCRFPGPLASGGRGIVVVTRDGERCTAAAAGCCQEEWHDHVAGAAWRCLGEKSSYMSRGKETASLSHSCCCRHQQQQQPQGHHALTVLESSAALCCFHGTSCCTCLIPSFCHD